MLTVLLSILGLAVPLFGVMAALQPDTFQISRGTVIAAPASEIFNQVNDLHNWNQWSPWAKLDPKAKATFEGAESGITAKMNWASDNSQVGTGSMTITESRPDELINFSLDFIKPFPGTSTAAFTFKPQDNQTLVT